MILADVDMGTATVVAAAVTAIVAVFTGLLARRNTKEHNENGARLERMEGKIDAVGVDVTEARVWQLEHEKLHILALRKDAHDVVDAHDERVVILKAVEGP